MSELKRIYACGSVDDGKSTLIGRLLHDTDSLYEDQINSVLDLSLRRGLSGVDFSLFTDGLSDERNQGITIDVAYRYFSAGKAKFIIADTPGHFQYTQNMASGSSDADIAIILVDINKGFNEQVLRHFFITALFKVPIVIFCINKMDLCCYDEKVYLRVMESFPKSEALTRIEKYFFIPISALYGDNIVSRSDKMPWYTGLTLKDLLEDVKVYGNKSITLNTLFSVQCIFKKDGNSGLVRGIAGKMLSGFLRTGEKISISPSQTKATIKELIVSGKNVDIVQKDQSTIVILDSELDVSRGDLIFGSDYTNSEKNSLDAIICCFQSLAFVSSRRYIFRVHSAEYFCLIESIMFKYESDFVNRNYDVKSLEMNDIVGIGIKFAKPIFINSFNENKYNGRFILIDPGSLDTVACGIVL